MLYEALGTIGVVTGFASLREKRESMVSMYDVWESEMVRASVLGDGALDELSSITDGYEQQKARDELADAFEDAERLRLGECNACRHFLFILLEDNFERA